MPIFRIIKFENDHQLGLWSINESLEELKGLAQSCAIDLNNMPSGRSDERGKQWLATRILLDSVFPDVTINYDKQGKPHLSNNSFISITHAKHFVGIYLNAHQEIGIDIEEVNEKVARIKNKFIGNYDAVPTDTLEQLTLAWSAKETMYKLYGKREVIFKENLHLLSMDEKNQLIQGEIVMDDFNKKITMSWKKIDNFVLVYTI